MNGARVTKTAAALSVLAAGCSKPAPAIVEASAGSASAVPVASDAPSAAVPAPPPGPRPSGTINHQDLTVYDFDHDPLGAAPVGLTSARTGTVGRVGTWIVQSETTTDGGTNQFVTQTDADATAGRFALLYTDREFERISVLCKMISGKIDQACGVVCGLSDPNNYYLARANALEGNVRLYTVEDGKRTERASWSGKITAGEWHRLELNCHLGFEVRWDGASVIVDKSKPLARDAGSQRPRGRKVGLWTKADSVTSFDQLEAGLFANL